MFLAPVMPEQYKQKKYSTIAKFKFGATALSCELEDKHGAGSWTIPYENIPFDSSVLEERADYLRNVGILFCLLGALYVIYVALCLLLDPARLDLLRVSVIWLPAGIACLFAHRVLRTKYTIFENGRRNALFN